MPSRRIEILDGWLGLYPRRLDDMLASPNILLIKIESVGEHFGSWYHVWGNYTRDQPWPWQLFRPSFRSHQQAVGNLTNEWTPVGSEPSISVVKLFHSTTWITGSRSRVCIIGLSWSMGSFSMVSGAYTHLDDMLASQYQSIWLDPTYCLSK